MGMGVSFVRWGMEMEGQFFWRALGMVDWGHTWAGDLAESIFFWKGMEDVNGDGEDVCFLVAVMGICLRLAHQLSPPPAYPHNSCPLASAYNHSI